MREPVIARSPTSQSASPLLGYDLLRLVAIIPIVAEHMLQARFKVPAIFGIYHIGQVGVTLFCALSGSLALQSNQQPPLTWLWKRVDKLLIPYWITLTIILFMNFATAYKPAWPSLIVAQYLGVGHFTHRTDLVGQVTWFISLILLCYLNATLVRWQRWMLPLIAISAAALFPFDPHTTRHVLSFIVGMILAASTRKWSWVIGIGLIFLSLIATRFIDLDYAFPIVAVCGLFAARMIPGHSPPIIAGASRGTFEFFLVHAPICLGVSKLVKQNLTLYICCSLLLSLVATWALQVGTKMTRTVLLRVVSIFTVPAAADLCRPNPS